MTEGALAAALAALCGPDVATAAIRASHAPPPWPGEAEAVARAVPARVAEFAGGRAAARMALARLGVTQAAIPAGPDRAPLWPAGIVGSIAHDAGHCLAAVARADRVAALGIDLEPEADLPADLVPEIVSEGERRRHPGRRAARRIFSAKEAAYKAQYPASGAILGFADLDVTLVPGGFVVRFLRDVPPVAAGTAWEGGQRAVRGWIVSAVVRPAGG